jgi:hypothetical protein
VDFSGRRVCLTIGKNKYHKLHYIKVMAFDLALNIVIYKGEDIRTGRWCWGSSQKILDSAKGVSRKKKSSRKKIKRAEIK